MRRTLLRVEELEKIDLMTVPPVIGSVVFDHATVYTDDYLMAQVQNATDAGRRTC